MIDSPYFSFSLLPGTSGPYLCRSISFVRRAAVSAVLPFRRNGGTSWARRAKRQHGETDWARRETAAIGGRYLFSHNQRRKHDSRKVGYPWTGDANRGNRLSTASETAARRNRLGTAKRQHGETATRQHGGLKKYLYNMGPSRMFQCRHAIVYPLCTWQLGKQ